MVIELWWLDLGIAKYLDVLPKGLGGVRLEHLFIIIVKIFIGSNGRFTFSIRLSFTMT